MADYDLNRVTPELIARAALAGDAIARAIYEKAGFYIGIAVANVCVALGPRKIVIAGGVAQAGDLLLAPIRRTLGERVTMMPIDDVEVLPAALGDDAGVIGAALWASDHV
jgi:glucokinase